jgi:S-adenosylmethionine uptake transporter
MPKKMPRAPLGASLVVLSSLFYASYGIWTKLIGEFFGAYTQAFLRCVLVALFLLPITLWQKQLQRVHWRRDAKWLVLSFLSSIFVIAPLYYAILHAGVGISLAVAYVGIVLGMFFFGWLFAGERFTKDKWLATALGVVGLWLVFSPSVASLGWLALLGALASGVATAVNIVASKKMPYSPSQTALFAWGLGALANLPFVFIFQEAAPSGGWHIEWLYLLIFALVSLIASWSVIKGVKLIEAGAAGVLGLLEIIFGVLFGVIFFNEQPGLLVLIGMASILAAAAIPYLQEYNAKKGTLEEDR